LKHLSFLYLLREIIQQELSPEKIVFFDRAIPDSDAYYKLCGLEEDDYLNFYLIIKIMLVPKAKKSKLNYRNY